jgi:hypothetical protein
MLIGRRKGDAFHEWKTGNGVFSGFRREARENPFSEIRFARAQGRSKQNQSPLVWFGKSPAANALRAAARTRRETRK